MSFKKQGALWAPAENGVGPMSANFGAGGVYPFKGSYLVNCQSKGIQSAAGNITAWPSVEGPLSFTPIGVPVLGTMPDGQSKCVSFVNGATEAIGIVSAVLNVLNGVNVPFLFVIDWDFVLNTVNNFVAYIGDNTSANTAMSITSDVGTGGGVTHADSGGHTVSNQFPGVLGANTRSIYGYSISNAPAATAYKCDPTTGVVTQSASTSVATVLALANITDLTISGITNAAAGPNFKVANIMLREPTVPTQAGVDAEITKMMQYLASHPAG